MKRYALFNIVKWVACITFVVFVFFQFYQLFYNPFTTGTAVDFETLEGIETVAVAIRDEKILTQDDVLGANAAQRNRPWAPNRRRNRVRKAA